jgi:hypothetical protein
MRKANGLKVERVIGGFAKNRRMVIEARLLRVGGALMADVRAFVATDDGRLVPTRAGLTLRPDQLPSLAKLIEDSRAAAEEERDGAGTIGGAETSQSARIST